VQIVNGALLKNPLNWLTVWLMLLIAAFAGHFFLRWAQVENPHDQTETQ
jgi:hypothetical protein